MRVIIVTALAIFLTCAKINAMEEEQEKYRQERAIESSKQYIAKTIERWVTEELTNQKKIKWDTTPINSIKRNLIQHKELPGSDMNKLKTDAFGPIFTPLKKAQEILDKQLDEKNKCVRALVGWTTLVIAAIGVGYKYGQGATLLRTCLKRGLCFCGGLISIIYASDRVKDYKAMQPSLKVAKDKVTLLENCKKDLEKAFNLENNK